MEARWVAGLAVVGSMFAQELPLGQPIERVECKADASQSYALYLPSNYSADRAWPVIFGFDPRARGSMPVERYRAAAEKYGYIVAGSNNSSNGSWTGSMTAAQAMVSDVFTRFRAERSRIYAAGMSGGARVSMGLALSSTLFAGVIASSAGFPDATPRKKVAFAVFGTAGAEDFNWLEMRRMDSEFESPHRLAIFDGGHVWLPSELAVEAIEWMEIQAIRAGKAPRDAAKIDALLAARQTALSGMKSERETLLALEAIVEDFAGLKDTAEFAARAAAMRRDKKVRDAIKKDRDEEDRERRLLEELLEAEGRLGDVESRSMALNDLRDRWKRMAQQSDGAEDSAERRIARRLLRGFGAAATERVQDPEYRKIVEQYRPARGGNRGEKK